MLGSRLLLVLFMWCNQLNFAVFKKPCIKAVAVIGFIANQSIRCILGKATVDGGLNQLHFMGRSAFNVSGDRKTREDEGTDVRISVSLDIAEIWITEKLT